MYQSDAKFHRFGGFERRHNVVQFKIRDKSSPSIIGISNTKPIVAAEPTTSYSSSSSSSIDPFDFPLVLKPTPASSSPQEEEEDTNVFDFPENAQEALEVKLMVASMRSIPHGDKKKKRSPISTPIPKKPPTKPTLKKRAPTPKKVLHNMDQQKACYSPQLKQQLMQQQRDQLLLKQKRERILLEQQIERAILEQEQQEKAKDGLTKEVSFDIFDFDYNPIMRPSRDLPSSTASRNSPSSTAMLEKKRKRNVVAHLKTARGETTQTGCFDFLSDNEEETNDILPLRQIQERSRSPELSYAERMELELEAMTKMPEVIPKSESKRATYTPQNKLNVKITFANKK